LSGLDNSLNIKLHQKRQDLQDGSPQEQGHGLPLRAYQGAQVEGDQHGRRRLSEALQAKCVPRNQAQLEITSNSCDC
jgi:hypothetical protein